MIPHDKVQDAINEAEMVASSLKPDNAPVAVTNKTLLSLIAAAPAIKKAKDGVRPGDGFNS